jgi:nucleoside-diphosphate-sugar epimerase
MKKILVTGSSGLIGSEVCQYFANEGFEIHGIDNNQRAVFFGPQGDTRWNQKRLQETIKHFHHHELDIRDRQGILTPHSLGNPINWKRPVKEFKEGVNQNSPLAGEPNKLET